MKSTLIRALIGSLLVCSATAVADPLSFKDPYTSSGNNSNGLFSPRNIYFGGSLGNMNADDFCNHATNCEDSDMGWKIIAGYDFNEQLGVEAGYHSLGDLHSSDQSSSITGYEISAIGKLPLNEQFEVFGKGGLFKWEAKNIDASKNSTDLMYGLGAQYKMDENLSIRGEWEVFKDIQTSATDTSDVDMLGAGFTYRTF